MGINIKVLCLASVLSWSASVSRAGEMTVEESGTSPDKRITVTSPGVYKAVVYQASGGGINEFYDLANDPDAKRNLGTHWGLFEVGWHGAALPKDVKPDTTKGDSEHGNYGCRFWPTPPNDCKKLEAQGELDIVEKSSARVRRASARRGTSPPGSEVPRSTLPARSRCGSVSAPPV